MKTIHLYRTILTGLDVANIDENQNFGPFKKLSISTSEWNRNFDEEIVLSCEDFGIKSVEIVMKVQVDNEGAYNIINCYDNDDIKIYLAEDGDLSKSFEIKKNDSVVLSEGDLLLVLVKDFLPQDIYKGAEVLFYIKLSDEV